MYTKCLQRNCRALEQSQYHNIMVLRHMNVTYIIFWCIDMVVELSICVLIFLFMVQRLGTDKVGYSFAPIMCLWFTMIGGIGLYNSIKYDPTVLKALNPKYIVEYFIRNKKDAWISLGGVVMCITGRLINHNVHVCM